jgi:hypothetical protein
MHTAFSTQQERQAGRQWQRIPKGLHGHGAGGEEQKEEREDDQPVRSSQKIEQGPDTGVLVWCDCLEPSRMRERAGGEGACANPAMASSFLMSTVVPTLGSLPGASGLRSLLRTTSYTCSWSAPCASISRCP